MFYNGPRNAARGALFAEMIKDVRSPLKAQLSEQPVVEEAPVIDEPAAKPIAHNPEKENPTQSFQWGMGRKESTMDRILNKLNN